jgi:hypothetical protein
VFKAKGRLVPHGLEPRPLPPQNRRKRGGPGFTGAPPGPTDAVASAGAAEAAVTEITIGVVPDPSGRPKTPPPVDAHFGPPPAIFVPPRAPPPLEEPVREKLPDEPAQYEDAEAVARLKAMQPSDEEAAALRIAPAPDAETAEERVKQAKAQVCFYSLLSYFIYFCFPSVLNVRAQVTVAEENGGLLYCPECYLPLHPDPPPEKLYIFLHAVRYTTSLGTFETGMPEWASEDFAWAGAPCRRVGET